MRVASGSLRHWTCASGDSLRASELLPSPTAARALAAALASIGTAELKGAAFLLARIAPADSASLRLAIDAANRADLTPRICLAFDSETLASIDPALIDGDRVGIAIDDFDAMTPLAAMLREGIEAVRFRPDFVASAQRSLRLGCALEAMLSLARDLGLCTLGWYAASTGGGLAPTLEFDYLPDHEQRRCSGDPSDRR